MVNVVISQIGAYAQNLLEPVMVIVIIDSSCSNHCFSYYYLTGGKKMNTIINWLSEQINRIKVWWSNNHERVEQNVEHGARRLGRGFDRIVRNITRLMIIGVILNVVASYFYPDFPEKFPAIYGWFDGWLQFGEFAVNAALNGIYSLFIGQWSEFWTEYNEAFKELVQQFTNWLSTLHF
jgi:predicted PurR-regulated permease PerM